MIAKVKNTLCAFNIIYIVASLNTGQTANVHHISEQIQLRA